MIIPSPGRPHSVSKTELLSLLPDAQACWAPGQRRSALTRSFLAVLLLCRLAPTALLWDDTNTLRTYYVPGAPHGSSLPHGPIPGHIIPISEKGLGARSSAARSPGRTRDPSPRRPVLWTSRLTSLCLRVPFCKMGTPNTYLSPGATVKAINEPGINARPSLRKVPAHH